MANIYKKKKQKNQEVDSKKKKEEELGLLPPKFSNWKVAKHVIGGLSVLGCVVVGILAALAGFLLPAFIAASLAIGFGGIFASELVEDYKGFQGQKAKYYSAKEKELTASLDKEKQAEAELDKAIAKEEEENSLESSKKEAIEKLEGAIEKTFDDGASKANVKEGSLFDAIKAGTQRAQDAIEKTFGSGEEMSR